jgi:hypothetical protein
VCCLLGIAAGIGPRLAILVWWLLDKVRWELSFSTWVWPLLGALFAPWTTLAYVLVAPGGVRGWDWALIVLGIVADIMTYSARGARRARRAGA